MTECGSAVSATHLDNRLVHFEVVGRRGQPIIFLHSWLGSWRYWLPTMDHISEKYRAYALDFWGFGESDRSRETFSIPDYVSMTIKFMDKLGLTRANLVGHGMGGMVAVRTAAQHPDRFNKLMIINTPLQGTPIAEQARVGAFSRLLGRSSPTNGWTKLIRSMPIEDAEVRDDLIESTEQLTEPVMRAVLASMSETDLRQDLAKLDLPLLAVYGQKDPIVAESQAQMLNEHHHQMQQLLPLPRSQHFPFLDDPVVFNRLLLDFLESQGDPVTTKQAWRRRVNQRDYL